VTASAHGDQELVCLRKCDSAEHVGGASTACDQRRVPIDHGVPEFARLIIPRIAGPQQPTPHAGVECFEGCVR
jgi:hypothetical protein